MCSIEHGSDFPWRAGAHAYHGDPGLSLTWCGGQGPGLLIMLTKTIILYRVCLYCQIYQNQDLNLV